MTGSTLAISSTNKEGDKNARELQISPVIDEWQVEYARLVRCSALASTHPSLTPVRKSRLRGAWISTAGSASVKLIYENTSAGTDDAVFVLSIRSKTLEVHYVSKMNFSWPQMTCMSGLPARGSRAVFLSYKDGVGEVQKFALRFSSIYETEQFMKVVKNILEIGGPSLLQCPEQNSHVSSQAEAISSHITIYRSSEELQFTQSVDNSTQLMIPTQDSLKDEVPKAEPNFPPSFMQLMNSYCPALDEGHPPSSMMIPTQDSKKHEAAKAEPDFPPSFAQLMSRCSPAVDESRPPSSIMSFDASLIDYLSATRKLGPGDLKTQFVQYLEGTPFKELLATVENVISQMGDDMVQ